MKIRPILNRINEAQKTINEIYLDSQDDYVNRIGNFKKSFQQKKNWYAYRFKIQAGINRANRLNPYKDIRGSHFTGDKRTNLYTDRLKSSLT